MEANQTTTLRTAWSQHRLTTTVVISLLAHLLAWGAVIWTGVLDPAVILAEKPEKKKTTLTGIHQAPPQAKAASNHTARTTSATQEKRFARDFCAG